MPSLKLKLFIVNNSAAADRALAALSELRSRDDVELEVIDVGSHPERAEEARIIAVPTLLRTDSTPPRRIIGDLPDGGALLESLGIPRFDDGPGKD